MEDFMHKVMNDMKSQDTTVGVKILEKFLFAYIDTIISYENSNFPKRLTTQHKQGGQGMFKCSGCDELMEEITAYHGQGYSDFMLSISKEYCCLFACTSRDCKDSGIVKCIPSEPKEY